MFDPARFVSDACLLPTETFDWGTLQWLCHAQLFRGAEQTLGICHIKPGARNPRHYHPNCEEVLYMLSGHGQHSFEDDTIDLKPGMTIRIPVGVTHNMTNTGSEQIACLIAFNSGNRETVFVDD
jgi:mannose-6-phosphate isomerase-like protein (cupin superfamily)